MINLRAVLEELVAWCEDLADAWHDWRARKSRQSEDTKLPPRTDVLIMLMLQAYGTDTILTRRGMTARLYFLSRLLEIDLTWSGSLLIGGPWSVAVGAAFGSLLDRRWIACSESWTDGRALSLVCMTELGIMEAGRLGIAEPAWWTRINDATDRLREAAAELEIIDPRQADGAWELAAQLAAGGLAIPDEARAVLFRSDAAIYEHDALELLRRLDMMPPPAKEGPGARVAAPGPKGGHTLA